MELSFRMDIQHVELRVDVPSLNCARSLVVRSLQKAITLNGKLFWRKTVPWG